MAVPTRVLAYAHAHWHTRGRTHAGTTACRGRRGRRATVLLQPPADADSRRLPRWQYASHTVLTTRQPVAASPPCLRCHVAATFVCFVFGGHAARMPQALRSACTAHRTVAQRGFPQVPPCRHGRALYARGRRPVRALDRAHARQRRAHRPAHARGGRAVRVWAAQPRPSQRRCGALGGGRRARTAVFVEACVRMGRGSVEQPSATSLSHTGVWFRAGHRRGRCVAPVSPARLAKSQFQAHSTRSRTTQSAILK